MKKSSNGLMTAILGGIITCFVCIGMVFAFSSNKTTKYKGYKNVELPNGITDYHEEEIVLGDCNSCMSSCLIDESQSYCEDLCRSDCATAAPTTTAYNCSGKSINDCNTGEAASHCSWCRGGCNPKSVCDAMVTASPTPKPTATPTPTIYTCWYVSGGKCLSGEYNTTCGRAGQALYSSESDCKSHLPTATPKPTATPTPTPTPKPTATPTPTTTAYNCSGKSINDCNTGEAASHCSWCRGGCNPKSVCDSSATPTATPKPTATATPKETTCSSGKYLLKNSSQQVTTQCVDCNNPGQYKSGKYCVTCPDGYKGSNDHPGICYMDISAGGYLVGGTTQILACPAGTYSTGGVYSLTGGCISGMCLSCTSCGSGKTSPMGSKSADACVAKTDPSDCKVTTSTSEKRVSYGSYYYVTIKVTGAGCDNGKHKMILSSVRGTMSDGSGARTYQKEYTVTNGFTMQQVSVKVDNQTVCQSNSSLTARITHTNGNSTVQDSTSTTSVNTIIDWHQVATDICVTDSEINGLTSRKAAEDRPADKYYIVKNGIAACSSQGKKTADKWVRGCGGSSTPTPTATPKVTPTATPKPTPKPEYCYKDDSGEYVWTSNPQSTWVKVAGISREADCKKDEQDACYQDPNGNYVWGKYAKKDGYQKIPAMTTKETCKKEEVGEACYKNGLNEYIWAKTAPEGYTKVDGVTTPAQCVAPEEPACYLHGDGYVWGEYANVNGYYKLFRCVEYNKDGECTLEEPLPKADCKTPETDACYKGPDGKYVWGKYGTNSKYELITDKKTENECTNEIPVPKTASNVSKLVYVFMAILMACGIGFIYYSNVTRKQKQ